MKKMLFLILSMCSMFAMGQITNQPKLRVITTESAVASDKAEVILEAHKVFGEFAQLGFQMLLDADANTYDNLFYDWSGAYYDNYDAFEYKIPENADASENSANIVYDDAVGIEIPAGVYDFMILCPFPGDGLIFTNGEYAKVDDFEFKGGNTYRFLVEYGENEYGYNVDMAFLYVDVDAAVTALNVPANSMDLTDVEEISVEITNRGTSAISGFTVSYQIDDNEVVTETYTATIEAGAVASYTFNTKADLSVEKQYVIKAWVTLEGDMIPSNDSMSAKCKHIGIAQLPYAYDFSDYGAEGLASDWIVEDVNEDDSKWEYNDWTTDVNGDAGAVSCSGTWSGDKTGNDNLISTPIHIPSGPAHIVFYTRCVNGEDATELLDVRFGTNTNVDEMTIIGDYQINQTEWVKRIINFNVENEGTYYFAFHVKSVEGLNVFIDELTIDAGAMEVTPSLVVEKVVLPYSNCDLSAESFVGTKLKNVGTGPTSVFTMTYSVNGGDAVTEEFTEVIQPTESATVYFNTTADFSEIGEYSVEVTAIVAEEENSLAGVVNAYEPVTELPVMTNFATAENYDEFWTEINDDAWYVDDYTGFLVTEMTGAENALLTRCLYLENSVRVKLQYSKGGWDVSRMYVSMGKSGEPVSDFVKVYENDDIQGDTEIEFMVPVTEADNYNFAIVNDSDEDCSLYLYTCTISNVSPYDIRIEDVTYPAAPYTPQLQLTGEGDYLVTVSNRGTAEMTGVKAYLYDGETLLGQSEDGVSMASDDKAVISLKAVLPETAVGDQLNLTVKVDADEEDTYLDDNVFDIRTINVTEDVYATENMEDITMGTGSWGEPLYVGNVYTITVTDVLESVTIGFSYLDEYDSDMAIKNIGLSIYSVDADMKLGRLITHTEFERGFGGFTDVELDPMRLAPGRYYVEVQQLSTSNMGLAVDPDDVTNACYQRIDEDLNKVIGPALAIRANFNSELTVYEKDAAVVRFSAPVKDATLFSDNETVSVVVKNNGYESADVPVRLSVNGTDYDTEVSLNPYEEKTVDFANVNMAEAGDYVAVAQVLLEGDENAENNELTKTFVSVEEADPYIMDFESCYDFDAAPDVFNPRWTTVDRNGYPTDYFWMFEHQYRGEPVGFIAFNPLSTKPAVTEDNLPGFTPHSGERFGAAFCVGYESEVTTSDVWLMSPKLKLGKGSSLELYVKTRMLESMDQELEKYRLLISDTDNEFESFVVLGDEAREAALEWERVEVDLSDYDGKDVYVAIQYVGEQFKNVCFMVDDIKVNTVLVDGLEEMSSSFEVYPNPAKDEIYISSEETIEEVSVYDVYGRLQVAESPSRHDKVRVDMSDLSNGVYFVKVKSGTDEMIKKIVKY